MAGSVPSVAASTVANVRKNYSKIVLGDGAVGYWPIQEQGQSTEPDSTSASLALGYVGKHQSALVSFIDRAGTSAIKLDGSGGLSVSRSPLSSAGTWSVEAWIDPANLTQAGVIAYDGAWGSGSGFGLGLGGGSTAFVGGPELVGLVGNLVVQSGFVFSQAGVWHHVVMTRSSGTIRFYVDGAQTTLTSTATVPTPSAGLSIGAGVDSSGQISSGFSGQISDVAVYSDALSATQIATHASRIPKPGSVKSPVNAHPPAPPPPPGVAPKPPSSLLADAKLVASSTPGGLSPTISAVAGRTALDTNGNVWTWGDNTYGQLGAGYYGDFNSGLTATPVVGLTAGITAIGEDAAIDASGNVWDWGDNSSGQLGNGSTQTSSDVPVEVTRPSGMGNAIAVATGGNFRLALDANHKVWAWGDDTNGELGPGASGGGSNTPIQVTGFGSASVSAIAAVDFFFGNWDATAAALDSTGKVWVWGDNYYGQTGSSTNQGTHTPNPSPNQVSGISGATAIGAGAGVVLALVGGSVEGWGDNSQRLLGNQSNGNLNPGGPTPATVSGISGVSSVTVVGVSRPTVIAVKSGNGWAWGNTQDCGADTSTWSATPTQETGPGDLISAGVSSAFSKGLLDAAGQLWDVCILPGSGVFQVSTMPSLVPTAELLGGGNPSELPVTAHVDGVDTGTGEFSASFNVLSIPGRSLPLGLTLTYSSLLPQGYTPNGGYQPFSAGWTDNYNMYLSLDSAGNATVFQENGSQLTFTEHGALSSPYFTAPSRVLASLSYSPTSHMYTFTRLGHSQLTFTFGPASATSSTLVKLSIITDLNGYPTTLAYYQTGASAGMLESVTDSDQRPIWFYYNQTNGTPTQLQEVVDFSVSQTNPRVVAFYYTSGQLTDIQANSGDRTGTWYNTQFTYASTSPTALIQGIFDARSPQGETGIYYTTSGLAQYLYDPVQSALGSNGKAVQLSFSGSAPAYTTTFTDVAGNQSRFAYQNNVLLARTEAWGASLQASWDYLFDPQVLGVTTVLDPLGEFWEATYDPSGNMLTRTDAAHDTYQYGYSTDGKNEPVEVIDPMNIETINTYTAHGDLQTTCTPQVTLPVSAITSCNSSGVQAATATYGYAGGTLPGDLVSVTDPLGKVWGFQYTASGGYLDQVTSPAFIPGSNTQHIVTVYCYDTAGRMTAAIDGRAHASWSNSTCSSPPSGHTASYTYDNFDQPETMTDPAGHPASNYYYDGDHNLTKAVDPLGQQTVYNYDPDNRTTAVFNLSSGGTTIKEVQTAYTDQSAIVQTNDGDVHWTTDYYDGLGHLYEEIQPNSQTITESYYSTGQPHQTTIPGGATITQSVDYGERPYSITYSDGTTPNVSSMAYDPDGRRTSMVEAAGTSSYAYDSLGVLRSSVDLLGKTTTYGDDLKGELTSILYPGQSNPVTRSYYEDGKLHQVSDYQSTTHTTSYSYDENRALTTVQYPNGVTSNWTPDADNQVVTISAGPAAGPTLSLNYGSRDGDERLTQENLSQSTGGGSTNSWSQSYSYDGMSQINTNTVTSGTGAFALPSVTIDPGSEVTASTDSFGDSYTLTYPSGQPNLQNLTEKLGSTPIRNDTYTFDNLGNRRQESDSAASTTTTFGWDLANRMTSWNKTGSSGSLGSATYSYNGDGLRYQKQVTPPGSSQQTIKDVWDEAEGMPLLLQESNTVGGNTTTNAYITGLDGLPLEEITPSGTYYYLLDQQGSVRQITDQNANVVASYNYDPYGNLNSGHSQLASFNPFQYGGQYVDQESSYYYLRAREYDPSSYQFLNVDPKAGSTREAYAYAGNSPTNAGDPTGMSGGGQGSAACATYPHGCQPIPGGPEIVTGAIGILVAGVLAAGCALAEPCGAGAAVVGGGTLLADALEPRAATLTAGTLAPGADLAARSLAEDDLANLASATRSAHILNGHMIPGEPGNTLFPAAWSSDQILNAVSDVATDPDIPWVQQTGPPGSLFTKAGLPARFVATGFRGGIWIKVVIEPAGEGIITGYPTA